MPTTQQTSLNYQEELKNLKATADYWKPTEGKHKLRILSEPVDDQFVKEDGTVNPQWRLDVELLESKDGVGKKIWRLPKSSSPTSLRGQLVKIGSIHNKLANEIVNLGVQGKGKERRYTIFEAL